MASKRGVTWEQFAAMGIALPGVETGTSYGTPALHVKKKFMARLRDDDPDHLVLKPVEEDEQRFLMETQPDVFFLTDHYRGYPTILVRLSKVSRGQLQELLEMCWRRLATPGLLAELDGASATPIGAVAAGARARGRATRTASTPGTKR